MATVTANNNTKPTSTPADETSADKLSGAAQKIREQVLSSVKQSQQLSIDAAQGWAKAVSALPVSDLPDLTTLPGVPSMPSMEAATKYGFDFAADLLNGQRDFALRLTNVLAPAKTS